MWGREGQKRFRLEIQDVIQTGVQLDLSACLWVPSGHSTECICKHFHPRQQKKHTAVACVTRDVYVTHGGKVVKS